MIELGLVLLVLLLLTVGITEFGRAFWYYSALQKAARDGARCASVSDPSKTAACEDLVIASATAAGVPGLKKSNIKIDFTAESPPEYVTVTVGNYGMPWVWSISAGSGANPPAAGDTTPIGVQATMPYTGARCSIYGC